mmetsp:Transcript_23748/g.59429  ORF Transcript_23748/g.59429 Transcript_23748/m.59429 type:complete len:140 (-) Transcript_23748:130-549(-)|eukprot:CAMPEP_0177640250 /NCGR_PEP_ID=MMETSP0447-20121125/6444_1 /TAXON_ID=0 /ORGANISM="Stygamoeba regulata, Strain BSH-02190019" /LENGTH=139 /DNA_ID=CAMNT_0019142311 /DNA_START=64 /DNA_END=483 /DNA_ORIENTATION=+
MNAEKLARLQKNVRTGGKGSVRRKRKVVRRSTNTDDKRIQMQLKRLNVNPIQGCDEVNLFTDDAKVIRFKNPKFSANFGAHTVAINGKSETVELKSILPEVLTQMGKDNMTKLMASGAFGAPGDDDEVPDLVDNFDAAQ